MPGAGSMWPPGWQTGMGYDPNLPYVNPTASVPRESFIRGYWASNTEQPQWLPPDDSAYDGLYLGPTEGVYWRAVWGSPIFDLRPDLEGSMGPNQEAAPIRGGVTFGAGLTLAAQIFWGQTVGGNVVGLPDFFNCYTLEFGHLTDPRRVRRINNVQDVTSDLYDSQAPGAEDIPFSVILKASPPSGVRYWQCKIVFDLTSDDYGPVYPPINDAFDPFPNIRVDGTLW